ncbi:MAG: peptide chain release factor N(5)-glutamine methyltransferase [Christensenellales bacterium]
MLKEEIVNYIVNNCHFIKNRDEAFSLICEILSINRSKLFLLDEISDANFDLIKNVINELNLGKPIAKILHNVCFYGYDFYVDENVLTPRQDSEVLVYLALNEIADSNKKTILNDNEMQLSVLDLCCGSGCLGLSIKKQYENVRLDLVDVSEMALEVAKKNAKKLNVSANFIQSDMFENITSKYDIIISNPPYIKTSEIEYLEIQVKNYDPLEALDGKDDGLYFYKVIANDIEKHLKQDGVLLCEFGYNQAKEITDIFDKKFKCVKIYKDNGGNDRVVVCKNLR